VQNPLQVTFQGCDQSDSIHAVIKREFKSFQAHDHRVTSSRVTVMAGSASSDWGGLSNAHLVCDTALWNIVVSHTPLKGK